MVANHSGSKRVQGGWGVGHGSEERENIWRKPLSIPVGGMGEAGEKAA